MKKLINWNWVKDQFQKPTSSKRTRLSSLRTFCTFINSIIEKIIADKAKQLTDDLETAVSESDSIANYQTREKGGVDKIYSGGAEIKRSQDATTKRVENEHEKAVIDLETHIEEIPKKKERRTESFNKIRKYIIDQRRIKLAPWLVRLTKAKSRESEIQDDLYKLSEELPKGIHTEKSFAGKIRLLVLGIVVLLGAELFATYNAFQILQAPPIAEIPIVIGVTVSLFVLGKLIVWLGKKSNIILWKQGTKPNIYDNVMFPIVLISLGFCVFLGGLRIEYLEQCGSSVSMMTKTFLYLLSPVLFIASTGLTALLANASGDVRKLYSVLLKKLPKQQKKVARIQRKIDRIKLNSLATYEREQQNYLYDIEQIEVAQTEELEASVLETANLLNDIYAISNRYEDQYYGLMASIFETSRANIESKVGAVHSWEPLNFERHTTDYQNPFSSAKQVQTQKPNIMKQLNGVLHPALFILGFLLFGSCSGSSLEGTDHTVIHLVDKTSLKKSDYHVSADDIWELAEMDESTFNGFEYHSEYISDVSLSKSHDIGIESANELLSNSLERKKEVKCTKKGLDSLMRLVYRNDGKEYRHTELFEPLSRAFRKVHSQPINESSTIILQSDLVHNHKVSLYSRDAQESEKVSEILAGIIPNGFSAKREVNVIVLHSPTVHDDEDFQYAYGLLKERFEEFDNIHVSLKANL